MFSANYHRALCATLARYASPHPVIRTPATEVGRTLAKVDEHRGDKTSATSGATSFLIHCFANDSVAERVTVRPHFNPLIDKRIKPPFLNAVKIALSCDTL